MKIRNIPLYFNLLYRRWVVGNRYYNWYVFSRQLSRRLEQQLRDTYANGDVESSATADSGRQTPQVIFVCTGTIASGGWADRLKGILSTYALCRELGMDFRLFFRHPFRLETYLQPANYDWRIEADDVVFDLATSEIVALEIGQETPWQARRQRE